jgi:hypothetical protein
VPATRIKQPISKIDFVPHFQAEPENQAKEPWLQRVRQSLPSTRTDSTSQPQQLVPISSSHPEQAREGNEKKKMPVRLPSTPTPTERPKARPQNRGTDHRHSLYSRSTRPDRCLCRQNESKMVLTVGCRGYRSSTRVGSVAPLGNTKEDEYYRNDSLKYCRHEEKKEKRTEILGARPV